MDATQISHSHTRHLSAGAPVQSLALRPHQRLILRVSAGRLWLTEDGRPDDHVLGAGEQRLLQGPRRYRLGAFGPEAVTVSECGCG